MNVLILFITIILFLVQKIIECSCESNDDNVIRAKRAMLNVKKWKWTKFPINYTVSEGIDKIKLNKAIDLIQNETCIRFNKVDKLEYEGLYFIYSDNCTTEIGRRGNKPHMIYLPKHCQESYALERLILHALGAIYEISRPDRDKYVEIYRNNAKTEILQYLEEVPECAVKTYKMTYDYKSILQMSPLFYSKNGDPVFKSKLNLQQNQIGYLLHMTFNDIKSLNYHYCLSKCKKRMICKNYGYTDPNNCKKCKCLSFFTGEHCEKFKENKYKSCGESTIIAKENTTSVVLDTYNECYWFFKARKGYRIIMEISKTPEFGYKFKCQTLSYFEVRYRRDKSVSGSILCGEVKGLVIESENEKVYVYNNYVGTEVKYQFTFKEEKNPRIKKIARRKKRVARPKKSNRKN